MVVPDSPTEGCFCSDSGGKLAFSMREILRNIQFIGAYDFPAPPRMAVEPLL